MNFKEQLELETEKFRSKVLKLQGEINYLNQQKREFENSFYNKLIENGWFKFEYKSEYYGSHPEYGEGDTQIIYLFAPSVNINKFKGVEFAHGHSSQNESNDEWDSFLESLINGVDYLELD